MAQEDARTESLRTHAYEYVLGVLWLSVFLCALYDIDGMISFAGTLQSIRDAAPGVALPDAAATFLVALGSIAIPYGVAIALRPVSLLLLNNLLRADTKTLQPDDDEGRELHMLVVEAYPGYSDADGGIRWPYMIALLETLSPTVGCRLRVAHEHLNFRATALVPASLLILVLTSRLVLPVSAHLLIAVGIGLALAITIFVIGSRMANSALRALHGSVDAELARLARDQRPSRTR